VYVLHRCTHLQVVGGVGVVVALGVAFAVGVDLKTNRPTNARGSAASSLEGNALQ
jgi:hypothetical protein